jgi:hypothetical protein
VSDNLNRHIESSVRMARQEDRDTAPGPRRDAYAFAIGTGVCEVPDPLIIR